MDSDLRYSSFVMSVKGTSSSESSESVSLSETYGTLTGLNSSRILRAPMILSWGVKKISFLEVGAVRVPVLGTESNFNV